MAGVKDYSTTAASNTALFPENMAPSLVNDSARQIQADVRSWYEDMEWRDWGHTVTRTGNTTFTIGADVTSIYVANRPIRCTDSSTLYGYVASSSFSSPNTTVTVTLDSGNLSASLTAVALGLTPSTQSIPGQAIRNKGTALFDSSGNMTANGLTINTSGSMTAGTVPLARMQRTYAKTSTISNATLTGSGVTVATLDLGTVNDGDIILVSAWMNLSKGATGGAIDAYVNKSSGTGALQSPADLIENSSYIEASGGGYIGVSGFLEVSTTGTLVLKMFGYSEGSNATANFIGLNAIVLNNG